MTVWKIKIIHKVYQIATKSSKKWYIYWDNNSKNGFNINKILIKTENVKYIMQSITKMKINKK
jgi:hypothetical protein